MKRDLSIKLLTPYGAEFEPSMTLEKVCYEAVTITLPEDQQADAGKKLMLYRIACKIAIGGVVDFTAEEVALLKDRVGKAWNAIVVGAAFTFLDCDFTEPA
jgi:hypothetical protein